MLRQDIANSAKKEFAALAELMPKDEPDFNQAIMEFGHYSS
jgi:adenine-specific DNA glycosylase